MTLDGITDGPAIISDNYEMSVSQAARLHSGSVRVRGIISGISKLKKIIKSQEYECVICGNIMKVIPNITFEGQKHSLADERPNLYQPITKAPSKCSNEHCESNIKSDDETMHQPWYALPKREYVNAIVIELRDIETFSDIDPLKAVVFDNDTIEVHTHLGEMVTINGNIHVITLPRKDTVAYLYVETIEYESSHEIIITAHDKTAFEKLVAVAKRRKMNVLEILGSMFASDIIGNNIIKQGMLLCAASTNKDEAQKKIHVLMIGDPGLAKSAMLRRSIELVPNSRYESAENSSGKSLTAIVEKEDESHILRTGPIPAAKGAMCALNELGRMFYQDQKHLLSIMQEQSFTINKHGINARITSPTAIIASANPVSGEWSNPNMINVDEIPAMKPLIDRFDLIFVTRNIRNESTIRAYASKKLDLYGRKIIPNYTQYLQKYIEYSKRFNPVLSKEAEHMLKEYYISIALNYGSPRLLEALITIAKMIARLKLKTIVDAEDADDSQQLYNVILQQLQQVVNVVTNPSDEAYNTCIEILQGSYYAMQFEELVKIACDKNTRVKSYIGAKYKLRENGKLRPILERLRNHSRVITVSEKPIVLNWDNEDGLADNKIITCAACDVCDVCDEANNTSLSKESNSNDTYNDILKNESISHASHTTHSSSNHIEESNILQQNSPRNAGQVSRISQHSDIWTCEDCTLRGDKWFMLEHNCKGLKN